MPARAVRASFSRSEASWPWTSRSSARRKFERARCFSRSRSSAVSTAWAASRLRFRRRAIACSRFCIAARRSVWRVTCARDVRATSMIVALRLAMRLRNSVFSSRSVKPRAVMTTETMSGSPLR